MIFSAHQLLFVQLLSSEYYASILRQPASTISFADRVGESLRYALHSLVRDKDSPQLEHCFADCYPARRTWTNLVILCSHSALNHEFARAVSNNEVSFRDASAVRQSRLAITWP